MNVLQLVNPAQPILSIKLTGFGLSSIHLKRTKKMLFSFARWRCSNYIFILNLTPDFNGMGKDNHKMRREAFKFWDLVRLILETLR